MLAAPGLVMQTRFVVLTTVSVSQRRAYYVFLSLTIGLQAGLCLWAVLLSACKYGKMIKGVRKSASECWCRYEWILEALLDDTVERIGNLCLVFFERMELGYDCANDMLCGSRRETAPLVF